MALLAGQARDIGEVTIRSEAQRAVWALHQRARSACRAAGSAGIQGHFAAWEHAGALAVLAADPKLAFLSTVSWASREAVDAVADLADDPAWHGSPPTLVGLPDPAPVEAQVCRAAGFMRSADRGLALMRIGGATPPEDLGTNLKVVDDASTAEAVPVLLAGYQASGAVAAYIAAEHSYAPVRLLLALDHGVSIAAAGMTFHDDVAVFGGAATMPAHRGQGGQSALLRHRLRVAAQAGCTLAVATAVPGSVSAANLRRVGFDCRRRPTWVPRSISARG